MCGCFNKLKKIWPKSFSEKNNPKIKIAGQVNHGVDFNHHQSSFKKIPLTQRGDPFSQILVLIINIHIYDKEGYTRLGSGVDVQRLMDTFEKLRLQIYFPETTNFPVCHQNIRDWIQEFKSKFDKNIKASFIVMMGHGVPGHIVDSGGHFMSIEENIFKQFDNQNFPAMRHRPKIFFMNFCRGDHLCQSTILVNQSASTLDDYDAKFLEVSATKDENDHHLDPALTDMLIFWSTVPGHASLRSANSGSRFIRTLCECLDEVVTMESKENDMDTVELIKILETVEKKMTKFRKNPQDPLPCSIKQTAYLEKRHFATFLWTFHGWSYCKN